MTSEQLMASFLCIWFGFAVSHQVHAQAMQDKIITRMLGKPGWKKLALARFIFFLTGILGVIGMISMVGSIVAFKDAVFPIGLFIGICLFLLTRYLKKGLESKDD